MENLLTNNSYQKKQSFIKNETGFLFMILLLVFLLPSCKTTAQITEQDSIPTEIELIPNVNYTLVKKIEISAKYLTTDKLLNTYIVTEDDELIKYNPDGKEVYRYSNFELGEISHVDSSNPFNILIFYQEFQTVEILNRTLDKTLDFDFFKAESPNIKAVGISNDQHVWLYDELNFKLKKINSSGDVIFESADLSYSLKENFTPSFVLESGGNVYLSEANGAVFIFDIFGNYVARKDFRIPTAKLQLLNEILVYRNKNIFYIKDASLGELENNNRIIMPSLTSKIIDAEIQKDRMVILQEDSFSIYTFEKK